MSQVNILTTENPASLNFMCDLEGEVSDICHDPQSARLESRQTIKLLSANL